jgi:hypothetical protein
MKRDVTNLDKRDHTKERIKERRSGEEMKGHCGLVGHCLQGSYNKERHTTQDRGRFESLMIPEGKLTIRETPRHRGMYI